MKEKEPEMGILGPTWWHHHGMKMKLAECIKDNVKIEGSAAWLNIIKAKYNEGWLVSWRINHGAHVSEAGGTAWFSDDDLKRAFGLKDDIPESGKWLIDRYGGTTADQGVFIRYKEKWLNIPCPGTGHDGDPNVSILLTKEIEQAVRTLLNNYCE